MNFFKSLFQRARLRAVAVILLDIVVLALSFGAIYLLGETTANPIPASLLWRHFLLLGACLLGTSLLFRSYRGLWYYAESREYLLLMAALFIGYLVYLPLSFWLLPQMLPVITSLLSVTVPVLAMLAVRFGYRRIRDRIKQKHTAKTALTPLVLVGAGDAAVMLLEEMLRNPAATRLPVCMVDDDMQKAGGQIHGVPIHGPISRLPELVKQYNAQEILIALPSAGRERNREILDMSMSLGCKVRLLPDMMEIITCNSPDEIVKSVRDVSIDDLLGRDPVNFEDENVYRCLTDKVVMVTGGGGSIGSELCRQIAKQPPHNLIILDIYENNAYDVQQELRYNYPDLDLCVEIASVRDAHKIDLLFVKHKPQIVFHAAAHKHVPLMEDCPEEAVRNNVFGTYNVATAADRHHADRFILVSTDKAVNPTNVMGATKRMCEMIVQSMVNCGHTRYAAVRFGNVLGSNGSVIPLFKRQIAHGGPVTITDKRIIRYFMTIPEAAQLVLQAGSMAAESAIFVLDMGQPVSILELAEHLIRLSGYTPYVDIPIEETGLRPGEKLYEELLMRSENLDSTPNNKIYVERQKDPLTPAIVRDKLDRLTEALATDDPAAVVKTLHEVVPTFKTPEEVNAAKMADLDYNEAKQETVEDAVPATV